MGIKLILILSFNKNVFGILKAPAGQERGLAIYANDCENTKFFTLKFKKTSLMFIQQKKNR